MSIIEVSGIPPMWNLDFTVKCIANKINGHFEALNFIPSHPKMKKRCYLRLSEELSPALVVKTINKGIFGKGTKLQAIIPMYVPDLPKPKKKSGKKALKMRLRSQIPVEQTSQSKLYSTHAELLIELQYKYPKLLELSKKTEHKLLEAIGRKILERLKAIMDRGGDTCNSCFTLSKGYRKLHPHFGDFQFVLSTLHSIQDATGQPREELRETDLSAYSVNHTLIDNLPYDKVQQACQKYSDRINKVVSAYVMKLNTQITSEDTEDDIARKKVRQEMKKMEPYLPTIVEEVVRKNFVPDKSPFFRIRIYGEPCLPAKDLMGPFIRKYNPVHVLRSPRMYNMLKLNVPPRQVTAICAMDGTIINGVKIVIRASDMPVYKISAQLRYEINAVFGVGDVEEEEELKEEEDMDWAAE